MSTLTARSLYLMRASGQFSASGDAAVGAVLAHVRGDTRATKIYLLGAAGVIQPIDPATVWNFVAKVPSAPDGDAILSTGAAGGAAVARKTDADGFNYLELTLSTSTKLEDRFTAIKNAGSAAPIELVGQLTWQPLDRLAVTNSDDADYNATYIYEGATNVRWEKDGDTTKYIAPVGATYGIYGGGDVKQYDRAGAAATVVGAYDADAITDPTGCDVAAEVTGMHSSGPLPLRVRNDIAKADDI